jgi:hypothetical protein
MANHEKWMELTIIEKVNLVGKVTHLLQNDLESYEAFSKYVKYSEMAGMFDEIKINEPQPQENE